MSRQVLWVSVTRSRLYSNIILTLLYVIRSYDAWLTLSARGKSIVSLITRITSAKYIYSQYSVAMSQLAPALGAFIGALVSYIISIVTCSIPIVFVLKKIESRYTQLGPEEDKKSEAVNGHQVELAVTAEPELSNGVEHVTSDDVAVVPLEEEIGDTVHKD